MVAVEVLPGKWLFALLGTNGAGPTSATAWAQVTFAPERDANNDARQHSERMKDIKRQPYDTPVPLPPEALPLMVTFTDIADPASVERVNLNDLEATFGPGVRLKAVTLEVTRAGVTEGQPEEVAHWLLLRLEVQAAMNKLPELQRQTLILHAEEGLAYQEIAEAMDTSIGTVKSRLF